MRSAPSKLSAAPAQCGDDFVGAQRVWFAKRMGSKKSRAIAIAVASLLAVSSISTVSILAVLPSYLDDFLLTNNDYCYPAASASKSKEEGKPFVRVDYGEYDHGMSASSTEDAQRLERENHYTLRQSARNSMLRRVSLHLWEQPTQEEEDDDNNGDRTAATACPIGDEDEQVTSRGYNQKIELRDNAQSKYGLLHPMCEGYRQFRSRLRFRQCLLPWNWYYRNSLQLRGLTIQSAAGDVEFVEKKAQPSWFTIAWSVVSGRKLHYDGDNVVPREPSNLPPSLEIDTLDVSFQSCSEQTVVSAHACGVVVNVVVQKGGFALPLQRTSGGGRTPTNGTTLLVGDMTIREVLEILPKPPAMEGLFPRIGLVNITNVTLVVYEKKEEGSFPLNLLMKMRVPDKFFLPITNMTLAHQQKGIDQKHFQPMIESSISDALRRHMLREASAAFHNSLVSAHKAQEQLHQFVLQTQELYLDRWIEAGVHAWHQTQENVVKGVANTTGPIVRAVEEWAFDLRQIVSEPVTPLAVVASHYWKRTLDGIHKYSEAMDNKLWGQINEFVATKTNKFNSEKRKPKQLGDLKDAFDAFVAKSGQDFEQLVNSCELEVKDMWLDWHRQFLPQR